MSLSKQKRAEYQRKQRDKRKALIDVYQSAFKDYQQKHKSTGTPFGFTAIRIKRDGSVVRLPYYMNKIFSACREFIDNAYRLPTLYKFSGSMIAMNREDTRRRLAKVLAVLLARTELVDGRVGVPQFEGMDTISHSKLMDDYVLRWGEMIDNETWYTCMRYIRNCGYFGQDTITGNQQNLVFSAAAYKQFSLMFFRELKVTFFPDIANLIHDSRVKAQNKGYNFGWMSFVHLLQKAFEPARKAYNAVNPTKLDISPH